MKQELLKELHELQKFFEPKKRYGMAAIEVPRSILKGWGVHQKVPHITLAYFNCLNEYQLNKIARVLQSVAAQTKPFEIKTIGQDWFGPEKDTRVVLVHPSEDIMRFRQIICHAIESVLPDIVDKKFPEYKPHITIGKVGEVNPDIQTDCSFKIDTLIGGIKDEDTYKIKLS